MAVTGKLNRKSREEWRGVVKGKTYELVWVQQEGRKEIKGK